jgi:type II secretory pathway pseudopilin PulG
LGNFVIWQFCRSAEIKITQLQNYPIAQLQTSHIPMIRCSPKPVSSRRSDRGYILITLILFVALITIAAVIMAPVIAFQVKRDREQELIHRGVQYSRAMKHFVKKFGRYPTRLEELENTNQIRFLRKRYKDPLTGKDFKILHMGDVQLAFAPGLAGAVPANGLNPGAAGTAGGPGGQPGTPQSSLNTIAAAGGLGSVTASNPGEAIANTLVNPTPGQNSDENPGDENATPNQGGSHPAVGPGAPGAFGSVNPTGTPQAFGGGPMVGVASTSKDKSIRIFNKKDHYNQWQFIYDPTSDRGGLLTGPSQPSLQGATNAVQTGAPGTPGAPGALGGPLGQPGPGLQPGQPTQPGMQTPQMPPDQDQ